MRMPPPLSSTLPRLLPPSRRPPSPKPRMSEPVTSRTLHDEMTPRVVVSTEIAFVGAVWNIRRDRFEYHDGVITREYVDHPGAVAILALDDDDRVLLIKQYRHPIAARDWELPAGLLDMDGESPVEGAKRELAEEADLEATEWSLLSEFFTSPGGSNEAIRIFLARGVSATADVFSRYDEEADMEVRWVPLDEVVEAVLARSIRNPILSLAVLAAQAAKERGFASLGDAEQAWPWHPKSRS